MPYYIRTVKSHTQTAPRVQAVDDAIKNLASQIHGRFPIAHPANRAIVNLQNVLSKLRHVLDDDFHSLMDDDEARREGNIYYGGKPAIPPPHRIEREEAVGIESEDEEEEEEEEEGIFESLGF